jgi:hypothetical protein
MQLALNEFRRAEFWIPWAIRGVRFLTILAAGWLLSHLAKRFLHRVRLHTVRRMDRRGDHSDVELERRAATVVSVIFTIIRWGIWLLAWSEITSDARFATDVIAGLEVFGVERLGEKGAVIRARLKTRPARYQAVGREFNLRVKQRFDAAGVTFPA